MQQDIPIERVLAVQRNDFQQAAIYYSNLAMKPRALILEGLGALFIGDAPSLKRCSKELKQSADEFLSSAAEQLRPLAQKLDQS